MNIKKAKAYDRSQINKKYQHGNCYDAAVNFVLNSKDPNREYEVVHGQVVGQGEIAGIRYGHSWVEYKMPGSPKDNPFYIVIDRSNGRNIEMPAMMYYGMGNIQPIARYNKQQLEEMLRKHKHYGPWDVVSNAIEDVRKIVYKMYTEFEHDGIDIETSFLELKDQVKNAMEKVAKKLKEDMQEDRIKDWEKNLWDGIYLDIEHSPKISNEFKQEMRRLIIREKLVNSSEMAWRYF